MDERESGRTWRPNRKEFIAGTTLASLGFVFADGTPARAAWDDKPTVKKPVMANDKIRFACIGVGGKGWGEVMDSAENGDIVALCDPDDDQMARAKRAFPNAKVYRDYRKMFSEMADQIDAVTVSTPDHHHYPASSVAMTLGKHVYCQKPLVRTIWEARQMQEIAKKARVATQMGNQGTAQDGLRMQAAQVRAGIIGNVTDIHVWSNRPVWPQGHKRGASKPVRPSIDWDVWIGPRPMRDYAEGYAPFVWRGFWDFGAGALGDMACHQMNMTFMALDLKDPVTVQAETSGHDKDVFPSWSIIKYRYPKNSWRGEINLTWYDGGKLPPADLVGEKMESSGTLIIGDKGKIHIPGDYGSGGKVVSGGVDIPEVKFDRSPGHFEEWVRAIRGGQEARSNFPNYGADLTGMALVGNLAVWCNGPEVQWDAKKMRVKNIRKFENEKASIEELIKPNYREGWKLV